MLSVNDIYIIYTLFLGSEVNWGVCSINAFTFIKWLYSTISISTASFNELHLNRKSENPINVTYKYKWKCIFTPSNAPNLTSPMEVCVFNLICQLSVFMFVFIVIWTLVFIFLFAIFKSSSDYYMNECFPFRWLANFSGTYSEIQWKKSITL